jgi:hypothetical protein
MLSKTPKRLNLPVSPCGPTPTAMNFSQNGFSSLGGTSPVTF